MNQDISIKETQSQKKEQIHLMLHEYELELEKNQKNHELLFQIGFLHIELGEYKDAIEYLKKSIKIAPTVKKYLQIGLAYCEIGEYEKSLKSYDNALELDRGNPETHNCKGFVLSLMGEHKRALTEFREALYIDNKYTDARLNMGYALMELGKEEEAIKQYDSIIDVNPKDCCAYLNKGYALASIGKSRNAIEAFSQSLSIRPDDACAHYYKGCAHYNCREYEEALIELDLALQYDENYLDALYQKAEWLKILGRDKEAVIAYTSILAQNPGDISIINLRGEAYQNLGNYDAAIEDYRYLIEHGRRNALGTYYISLLNCQYMGRHYQDVIDTLKQLDGREIFSKYASLGIEKIRADSYFALEYYEKAHDLYVEYLDNSKRFLYGNKLDHYQEPQLLYDRDEVKKSVVLCRNKIVIPDWLDADDVPELIPKKVIIENIISYLKTANKFDDGDSSFEIDDAAYDLLNRCGLLYADELTKRTVRACGNCLYYKKEVRETSTHYKKEIIFAVKEKINHHNHELEKKSGK